MASIVPVPRFHAPVQASRPTRTKDQRATAKKEHEDRREAIETTISEVNAFVLQACAALAERHGKTPDYYRKEILGIVKTVKERAPNMYNMYKEYRHSQSGVFCCFLAVQFIELI